MKVEIWLNSLMEAMREAVKKFIKQGIDKYEEEEVAQGAKFKRVNWVMNEELPAQAVTVCGSILWARNTELDI